MILLHRQRGATLFVALIILVLLTLMAISAMQATTSSIQVVGNAQFLEEANAAGQARIEEVISTDFTAALAETTVSVPIGPATYTVKIVKPTCKTSALLTPPQLNALIASDANYSRCSGSLQQDSVSIWCNQQQWDIEAQVSDTAVTGVSTKLHQGVGTIVGIEVNCD